MLPADKTLVDYLHDFYSDKPVPKNVENVLTEICAGKAEGKSINQIRRELENLGYDFSFEELQDVVVAYETMTGEKL